MTMTDTQNQVVSSSENSDAPNYDTVDIPSKPPSEFTYHERRAEILQQVRDLGHPSMVHQGELADRYGVSQQQISKDLDRIAESVRTHITDPDNRAFAIDSILRRSIRGLLDEDEYRKAAQTALEYDDWIREQYETEELRQRIEALEAAAEREGSQ